MKTYSPESTTMLRNVGYALGVSCVMEAINPVQAAICRENARMAMEVFEECERHGELP